MPPKASKKHLPQRRGRPQEVREPAPQHPMIEQDPVAEMQEDIRNMKATIEGLQTQVQNLEARMTHLYSAAVFPERRAPPSPHGGFGNMPLY